MDGILLTFREFGDTLDEFHKGNAVLDCLLTLLEVFGLDARSRVADATGQVGQVSLIRGLAHIITEVLVLLVLGHEAHRLVDGLDIKKGHIGDFDFFVGHRRDSMLMVFVFASFIFSPEGFLCTQGRGTCVRPP